MKILITGGAGYIGSHTAKAIAQAGFEAVVLDNLSTGHRWAAKWGAFIEGDLADRVFLAEVFRQQKIEAVAHFAANAYVGESMKNPRKYFRNNVANTLNLLESMLDAGVMKIVFSSSCTVYGMPETLPIRESHPLRAISPYGESKLFVERMLGWFSQAYELKSVALRYFNAAGADESGETGEMHTPETHLIPLVIEAALGHTPCVDILGTDYETKDGSAVRDYIHTTDLADAHVRALSYLLDGGESRALNLGTGIGYSVREVIAAVEKISGKKVPVRESARRLGDPPVLVAESRLAKEILGWEPRYSHLEHIIRTAWNWHNGPIFGSPGVAVIKSKCGG